jgi:hypothetical protein
MPGRYVGRTERDTKADDTAALPGMPPSGDTDAEYQTLKMMWIEQELAKVRRFLSLARDVVLVCSLRIGSMRTSLRS